MRSAARWHLFFIVAAAASCAHQARSRVGAVEAVPLAPQLIVESPVPGTLVHTPEVDVIGRVLTYDGRAWVFAESTPATLDGGHFSARAVSLRAGPMEIKVSVTDGRGQRREVVVPIVVETPDRPRKATLCRPKLGCLRYEERGTPRRDAKGEITNAAIVLSAFGFDERLDELWPDLVGPGRPLDSRERFVLGVAGAPSDAGGPRPGPDALLTLVEELLRTRHIDRHAALIGASSYGAELVLRSLVRHLTDGPVLVCGGHDRPYEEPAMQAVRRVLRETASQPPRVTWLAVARSMVPLSYGPGYLLDPRHAVLHGLPMSTSARGLEDALVEQLAAHFVDTMPVAELVRRMDAAFDLESRPLVYLGLAGRQVVLVGNRDDQMMSMSRIRALALRLRLAGARVSVHELSDALGHSVFFHRVPLELEAAVRLLFTPTASAGE